MGVFAALALFSRNYLGSLPGLLISFLLVTCFVILLIELWTRFEKDTHADELIFWFQGSLFLVGFSVATYWSLGLRLIDRSIFYQIVSLSLASIVVSIMTRIARERGYMDTAWWNWLAKKHFTLLILLTIAGLLTFVIWIGVHNYLSLAAEPFFNFLWMLEQANISTK